jgi:ubiquinone/menaquinone biosynthesis C-methylase UbiE
MVVPPGARYDDIAATYDATRGWPPEIAAAIGAALHAQLAPFAPSDRPLRVVEVGAGTGRVLAPLAAQGAWTIGVDLSPGMLGKLRAKQPADGGRLHAVIGDAQRLPFASAGVDAVLLVHILHLVDSWTAALAEAQRVMRPAGALAFGLDETAPGEAEWINARWVAHVAAAGGTVAPNRREAATAEAAARLAAAGYIVHDYVLAAWTQPATPQGYLGRYRERCIAASWDLPDAILTPAVAGLHADLLARYGSLSVPLTEARSFRLLMAHR